MSADFTFGAIPLHPDHFQSDLAKAVFNDKGHKPVWRSLQHVMEERLLEWLENASPRQVMLLAHQLDRLVVPMLTPACFRNFCSILCENLPQVIEGMPHTRESVSALARAIHLAKFINPAALDRIHDALILEGLVKS